MPKPNMYQSLHTTVIGPEGKPLEIQIRTHAMHRTAEFGVAAHWLYKAGGGRDQPAWVSRMMDWQSETRDPGEFMEALRSDLYSDEVFVFTPEGRGARPAGRLDAARLRLRRAHRRRPPLRGRQGQRPHRAAHLHAPVRRLRRDPHLEGRARSVARLAHAGQDHQGPLQDQPVLPPRAPGGRRAPRPRRPAGPAPQGGPAQPAGGRLPAAARGHEGDGLPEGRGVLHLPRPREDVRPDRGQQDPAPPEDRAVRRRRPAGGARRARPPHAVGHGLQRPGHRDRGRRRRPGAPGQVLQAGARRRHPGLHLPGPRHHDPPRGLPQRAGAEAESRAVHARVLGRRQPAVLSSRDRRRRLGSARICWRTSRGRSPRTGSTSCPRTARWRTRWSTTASPSRWATGDAEARPSTRCDRWTRCSTPTGSRRARSGAAGRDRRVPGAPEPPATVPRRWPGSTS